MVWHHVKGHHDKCPCRKVELSSAMKVEALCTQNIKN